MNLCDELANTLKISSNMKKEVLELIENEISIDNKNKLYGIFQQDDLITQKLQKILFYLCLEKDVDYFKYGFSEPAITLDNTSNNMSEQEIKALMSALNDETNECW